MTRALITAAALWAALASPAFVAANQPAQSAPPPPQFVSPEVLPDQRVAFRIYAPQARAIRLSGSDIPGVGRDTQLIKGAQFAPVFKESPGGHTWINWRNYLVEFTPQLFQGGKGTF